MHLKAIPFQCKMCDVVCLLFGVEDYSIIVFCHLCVLCDFIVHYSIFIHGFVTMQWILCMGSNN